MTIRSKTGEKADFVGSRVDKMRQSNKKLKNRVGVESEDIHVCIMCLRAIMNNKFGFNMVIAHEQAINCIALSLVRFFIFKFFLGDKKNYYLLKGTTFLTRYVILENKYLSMYEKAIVYYLHLKT